jgi:hypothetical protein
MLGPIPPPPPILSTHFHERLDLVVENLLLQLQVALRSRSRPHLKSRDRSHSEMGEK